MGTTHNDSDQDCVVHQHGYEDDIEQARQRGTLTTTCDGATRARVEQYVGVAVAHCGLRRAGRRASPTGNLGTIKHDDDDEQRRQAVHGDKARKSSVAMVGDVVRECGGPVWG
jgi:hypothetical protein